MQKSRFTVYSEAVFVIEYIYP